MADEPKTDTPEAEGQATATAPETEGEAKKLHQQVEIRDVGP